MLSFDTFVENVTNEFFPGISLERTDELMIRNIICFQINSLIQEIKPYCPYWASIFTNEDEENLSSDRSKSFITPGGQSFTNIFSVLWKGKPQKYQKHDQIIRVFFEGDELLKNNKIGAGELIIVSNTSYLSPKLDISDDLTMLQVQHTGKEEQEDSTAILLPSDWIGLCRMLVLYHLSLAFSSATQRAYALMYQQFLLEKEKKLRGLFAERWVTNCAERIIKQSW